MVRTFGWHVAPDKSYHFRPLFLWFISFGGAKEMNILVIFEIILRNTKMSDQENNTSQVTNTIKKNNSEEKWYALYTRPRAEKLVYQRLIEEEIETFLPLQKTYRTWSDRKKLVEKPLLSSYIFVKTHKKNFPKVYTTNGVVKFVSFEGQPVSIPQKQIDNLRLLVNSEAEIEVSSENFAKGDNVEVTSGSLIGLTGELIKIGNKNRVVVRIDRLDQNLILKIPKAFLKKV
jgi:transcriptional antiterminator RfaH